MLSLSLPRLLRAAGAQCAADCPSVVLRDTTANICCWSQHSHCSCSHQPPATGHLITCGHRSAAAWRHGPGPATRTRQAQGFPTDLCISRNQDILHTRGYPGVRGVETMGARDQMLVAGMQSSLYFKPQNCWGKNKKAFNIK